jgi:biopolymer transport protein ExbD
MGVRVRTTASVAIILIFVGIALPAGYRHWMDTRTFVALDMPVSLSPGHIKTPDFDINLEGWYEIWINTSYQASVQDCRYSASDVSLKTHYTVHRDGHEVPHSEGKYQYLGHFFADKSGRYGFDLVVVSDVACLNSRQPRITVWTSSDRYELLYDQLLTLSVVLVLGGLGILAFSTAKLVGKRRTSRDQLAVVENAGYEYHPSLRKLPLRARFSRPPSFGLVYSVILASVLMPSFLIFIYAWGYDHRSVGIEVRLLHPGPLRALADSWTAPLVVRVENSGVNSPPRLYLNSKAVAWDALSPSLKTELKSRSEWVVFVEAGLDVNWGDAVNAMDIIRGAGAKVVLLTTETAALPPIRARRR